MPTPPPANAITDRLAADRLGTGSLVAYALCAATPLTVVAGVTTTGIALTGQIGLPVAFLAIAAVLALFAIGYTAMAARIPNAGAFYAFIAQGLNPAAGVGAAWIAYAAYTALTAGLYGLIGVATPPLLDSLFGIVVPWWVAAGACWLLVAILGTRAVDLNGRILTILLVAEGAIITAAAAVSFANPRGGEFSFAALDPVAFATSGGGGALLALAFLGCVGFEAPAVYAEESRHPTRTVRRATFLTLIALVALYAPAAWALTVAVGPDHVVDAAAANGIDVYFNLIAEHLGGPVATAASVLLVTSVIAAAISFHNTTARYMFALGREGVLPESLGRTRPRTGAPARAALTQSVISGVIICTYAALGLDPLVDMFYTLGTAGGYAILLLVALAGFAVVRYFTRNRDGMSRWQTVIAPVAAAVLLTGIFVLATVDFGDLLGAPPGSNLPVAIPVTIAAIGLAGTVCGLVLAFVRPRTYQRIGAGPAADRVTTTTAGR
ncbi:APC family permease [Glycomyces sp. YM15]|uniref:APC family permease n=1 Tax=Glycomyces sp. YM15 TaxID=2800446 RepID=UPI001965A042|nr:APC family permease [Glycomyces sp. YM15]